MDKLRVLDVGQIRNVKTPSNKGSMKSYHSRIILMIRIAAFYQLIKGELT